MNFRSALIDLKSKRERKKKAIDDHIPCRQHKLQSLFRRIDKDQSFANRAQDIATHQNEKRTVVRE